ncbi:MAG: acrR3 [Acidimicrobiales bacterium]|nr:acrR3 [Acidimicrobiales bacterium]
MDFAATRFAANGYHPTSVAEIVEGLGVGKGVFYWYFSSKEELFTEILAGAYRDLRRRQGEAIGDTTDPLGRIERGVRASMEWSVEHRDVFRLFQLAAGEARFATILRKGEKGAVSDAARHIQGAMDAGLVAPGDPHLLAHAMLGVTTHLVQRHLLDPGAPAIDQAVSFCLHGVLGGIDRQP